MEIYSADKIRTLARELSEASFEGKKAEIRAKLDRIADEREFGGSMIEGEDGPDRDDAMGILRGYGAFTVVDHFGATYRTIFEPRKITYKDGMSMLGLPDEDVERLATSFEKGHISSDVIDAVVNHQAEINGLHPDKYPFEDIAYDVIANGLSRKKINTKKVWASVMKNLIKRNRTDLALRYGYDPEPTNALTGFLAHYALTKHNIGELNRTGRELHF